MIAENATFKGRKINMDGGSFYSCQFDECTIVFNGLMPATMDECTFNGCIWQFLGPAENTIRFMRALYSAGAADMIENTFQSIRGKTAGPSLTLE